MNTQELKDRYSTLYAEMAASGNPKNMEVFGHVMTEMMDVMLQKMPDAAEDMIDKMESIHWRQYLTPKEAEAIVAKMNPQAPWPRDAWQKAMEKLSLPIEEQPAYNRCALWVEMNKQYSDHGESVASLLGQPLAAIPAETIVPAMHKMALDLLKDKDGVYDIRHYFNL